MTLPLGPEVDSFPRPLPAREKILGNRVSLEPLQRRHGAELFEAARGADESFAYMSYGPFGARPQIDGFIAQHASLTHAAFWAVRPVTTGRAS
ncbi:MAG TPA: GNAT family N-acetyltransferase, partial [Acidocella sp.]|nr:GNAT family N-acetyltransferase [Acidocella sp.]